MTRVSTVGNYSSVLANLMAAQQRQIAAGEVYSTQKNGTDLKDYARNAEMLTAMRSIDTRVEGYIQQNKLIADRLTTQDMAFAQISDSAQATKQALTDALAAGRADTLMLEVEAQMRNIVQALNTRYGGKYLFAGGQIDTQPVTAISMSSLTDPMTPAISDFFKNDDFITSAKIDDATTVKTGFLADDVGANLLDAFKTLQAFQEGVDGPFNGELTQNQKTFLESQITAWDTLHSETINVNARNGMLQSRVEGVKTDLDARQTTLKGMMGDIVDADMAQAATQLQQAQLSVQAATQVFLTLKESSLLNVLR